jgi:uncharacterized protein
VAILVDTGPIVALLDRRERFHQQCVEALLGTNEPLITCETVIAEACFLLRRLKGASRDLLVDVQAGRYLIDYRLAERGLHLGKLLDRYANIPMDLADACLVDLANLYKTGRIFTLDADFRIYRWGKNYSFELLIEIE